MPFCTHCGVKVEARDKFSKECGAPQPVTPKDSASNPARELKEGIELAKEILKPDNRPKRTFDTPVSMDLVKEWIEVASRIDHYDEARGPIDKEIKMMIEFKNIVPESLFNRIMELYLSPVKNYDELELRLGQLTNVYRNYQKIVNSPVGTLKFERLLWKDDSVKDQTWAVTNLRVYLYNPETKEQAAKGLLLSNVKVENVNNNSKIRVGEYTLNADDYGFRNSIRDQKVSGDLVFSFTGKETLRLVGITDPEDLRKLVENMQIDQRTMLNR